MQAGKDYDVIVVGGGHAGIEAALAAARCGSQTLLLTQNIETIGQMSCNPAIGGIGKGHLVREVDALGGFMATGIDRAGIQFRILNASKGPAVRATRAQADKQLYRTMARRAIELQPNLEVLQQMADDLLVDGERVTGVMTAMGVAITAQVVVLTAGTFLAGRIHIGLQNYEGGRAGDPPSNRLADRLRELALGVGRLKTGTPPRLDGNSIDFSMTQEQPGDEPVPVFSFLGHAEDHPQQVSCFITATNERTHEIIRQGLSRSPLYTGVIQSKGPRYCPSIEDKVVRFAQRNSHHVFLEPEGLTTSEFYPNGISTSLPYDVQKALVQSIRGCEKARIVRPGYAIEYDFFDPRGLEYSLETKALKGLFFAGQVNGTTGYEEAAAQGLLAGVNAALQIQGRAPWSPARNEAYLGVMVDDLITCGTQEPYRMFTSRAEYRLQLREDNADLRLTEIGRKLGLVGDLQWQKFCARREAMEREISRLRQTWVRVADLSAEQQASLPEPLHQDVRALDLLARPGFRHDVVVQLAGEPDADLAPEVISQVEIQVRYAGYINRQQAEIDRQRAQLGKSIPDNIDYQLLQGISSEIREKLERIRPHSVGQAARIPGMTPAAVSLLLIHLKRMSA